MVYSIIYNNSNHGAKHFKRAFTIVELLVVIVVIAILSVIAFVSYSGISSRATASTLQSDLAQASKQLKMYYIDHGFYPSKLDTNNCPQDSSNTVDSRYCIKTNSTNTYTYSYTDANNFTLYITKNGTTTNYKITNDTSPQLSTGIGGIDSYTKLMLHGEDLSDSSGGAKATSVFGSAASSAIQSKFGGKSLYFNGVNSYLSFADSNDFDFGSGDFTIDWWMYPTTTSGDIILYSQFVDLTSFIQVEIYNNVMYFYVGPDGGNGGPFVYYYTGQLAAFSNFSHFAWVRSGTSLKLYRDGTELALTSSATILSKTVPNISSVLTLGDRNGGGRSFTGYFDELRISKGIARWTSNFTPPTQAYSN